MSVFSTKVTISQKAFWNVFPELKQFEELRERVDNPQNNVDKIIPIKLLELWHMLLRFNPEDILELGPGWTTLVFLKYRNEICFDTNITSIEESEDYINKFTKIINKIGYVHGLTKTGKIVNHESKECHYNFEFKDDCDLVYVDGPANTFDDESYVCTDIIDILENQSPKTIVFDWRNSTFLNACNSTMDKYESFPGATIANDSHQYHNVLRRIR